MTISQEPNEDRLERIERIVSGLADGMAGLRDDVAGLKGDVADLKGDVADLKGDVADLKGDVAGLKGDVAGLKGDVAGLKGDVAGLKGDVAGLKGDVAGLKGDMDVMKGWQTELAVERRAGRVFARLCGGELVRIYPAGELRHYINQSRRNQSMTRVEADRAESIDFLLEGTDDSGRPVIYAVEVSFTAGPDDINRAVQKADLLTRLLGRQVKPAVVGENFTARFEADAALKNVDYTYIRNGDSIKR